MSGTSGRMGSARRAAAVFVRWPGVGVWFFTVLFDQKADRLLLPLLYLSRMQHLQPARLHGSLDAFERPAAPAFFRGAARYRQPLLLRKQPHPRHVPPEPLLPDTAHPGVPPRQAAGCLRGCTARRRAWRFVAGGLCLPCGQACLPVSVWVLPYHQSPPSQIGDKLFEVSSKVFQMVVKIILYLIDIDKTVPQKRHRHYRLRPCQGNRPADCGQQTRLYAIIYRQKRCSRPARVSYIFLLVVFALCILYFRCFCMK